MFFYFDTEHKGIEPEKRFSFENMLDSNFIIRIECTFYHYFNFFILNESNSIYTLNT